MQIKSYDDYKKAIDEIKRDYTRRILDIERQREQDLEEVYKLAKAAGLYTSSVEIVVSGKVVEIIPVHLPGVSHLLKPSPETPPLSPPPSAQSADN